MWLSITAIILSLLSASLSLWNFLDSRERPKKSELRPLLEKESEAFSKESERRFRGLEMEWEDMYQKFGKLAGRMDRNRAPVQPPSETPPALRTMTRADILRRSRSNQ